MRETRRTVRGLVADDGDAIGCALIRLIHQGAPAAEFAQCLVAAEALPDEHPQKSTIVESVRRAMAVHERLDLHQQRERGLLAVIASSQDLSCRLDFHDLLRAIIARARNLLGSDLGWLSILDPERDAFQVLMADGALSHGTSAMATRHDCGVASVVMSTRLPFATADYLHDTRFAHDPTLDDTFRNEGIVALVGVPLIWENAVVGLLFVADRYHRTHTAQSISILCALATHAAVALKNARDFERVNDALAKAAADRAELERHLRSIQAAADAHEQMTTLLARGASLATLCDSVARSLNGRVVVFDEAGRVVARSVASESSHAVDVEELQGTALARALRTGRSDGRSRVAFEVDGETCRVMPVIGGDDVLGSVALFHRATLDEVAIRTFERSSSVIGIVLLSEERKEATKRRGVATRLRSLVAQRNDARDGPVEPADHGDGRGLHLSRPLSLLMVEMERPGVGYALRRLRDRTTLANALADDIDGVLVVLCQATCAVDVRQAVVDVIHRDLKAVHRGVLSRPVAGPAEVPALYATLRRAMPVLARMGVDDHVVDQDELALYSTLFETHDRTSLGHFLDATIGPLLAHDARRGSMLATTLLHYFDEQRNAKATARRLHVHVNTMRQRLATIESLIGPWTRGSRGLELHVALRLWRLRAPLD